jgi:hypothetical protein
MATKKKKATKAKKKTGNGQSPAGSTLTAKVQLIVSDEVASQYVNFAEVAHSTYEFIVLFARVPTKATPAQAATVRDTGILQVEPQAQMLLPPALVPGLIRALQTQLEKYEEQHGKVLTKDKE